MPRHVVRYFMGRRRRHHRRRIPTASRYISGCTVNPSGPAVRRLHRGRSPEFRERSSPPSFSCCRCDLYSRCVYVCMCARALMCTVPLPPRRYTQYVRVQLSPPVVCMPHYHRGGPSRRTIAGGSSGFFPFPSSFYFPRSGPRYSRLCLPRSPDG